MKFSRAHWAPAGLLLAVIVTLVSLVATEWVPVSAMDTPASDAVADLRVAPEPPLSANSLHADLRLPPLRCELPAIEAGAAGQRQYVQAALDCVEQAWGSALRSSGMAVAPIKLVVVDQVTSGCSRQVEPTDAAFYCDGSVYWPVDDPIHQGWGSFLDQYLLFVVMHEYGHHLQSATGILREADGDIGDAGEQSALGLEISRRIELQAQCLAGVTLAAAESGGTVTSESAAELLEIQGDVEGDDTHGTGASSRSWTETGYRSATTSACNTWAAAPNDIS